MKSNAKTLIIPVQAAQKIIEVFVKVHEEKKEKGEVSVDTIEEAVEVMTKLIFKHF